MRLVVLVFGLMILIFGVVALVSGDFAGAKVSEEITRTFSIEDGQELRVQSLNGRITVESWDEADVKIEVVKVVTGLAGLFGGNIDDRVTVEFVEDDSGVQAIVKCRLRYTFLGNVTVRFNVWVPRGWTGDVSLVTSNGPISVKELSANLEARTSNGRIELTDVNGVVQARTSNGSIRVEGATLSGSGQLRTSNGAVSLVARLDQNASYEVRTSNGAVSIALVEPDVSLDLSTSNGSIDLRTEVIVSRHDRRHLEGRIGDGAATLTARTSNGSIRLSKAD